METAVLNSDACTFGMLRRMAAAVAADLPRIGVFSARRRFACFISICQRLDEMMKRGELSVADTQRVLVLMSAQSARAHKAVACFEAMARYLTAQAVAALPLSAREYFKALRSFETGRGIPYRI